MRRNRKVKILATLGPASSNAEMIKKLHTAGADIFRINMSHAPHDHMRDLVAAIRGVEAEVGRPIAILVDLQGPKLRVGMFENDAITLKPGQEFILDSDPTAGNETRVQLPHPEILEALEVGHRILLDDGRLSLKTISTDGQSAVTKVVSGTKLSNKKGVSLPDTLIKSGALTSKDRADLDAALKEDIDWIALSFVQRPEDIEEVRNIAGDKVGIMAKIEKPQALDQIEEIIDLSDGIMVARGDLGVELPVERVPGIQKQLIRAGRRAGKPVVVATQMLESMITAPVPTRAEVSDVATAVFEGSDAVMLSAESAAGDYPVEAVSTMDRIAEEVECDPNYTKILYAQRAEPEATGADAVSAASRQIAETLNLSVIVCFTSSGATGIRASRERPETPIIASSPVTQTARRLTMVWGLHCVVSDDITDEKDMVSRACKIAHDEGFAAPGERVIISAGVPFGIPGSTNLLRIAFVADDGQGGV
ncbi:MAG: pyruvate kinase [Hyphomicrobiales bacterium]